MRAVEYLDQQVRAACPHVHGIRIGRWGDKNTWSVTGDGLTRTEIETARAIFEAFDKAAWETANPEPTRAMRLIDQIKADPDALAALKAELAK